MENLLRSDDTERMLEALALLGVAVERRDEGRTAVVRSQGGPLGAGLPAQAEALSLFLGNAGTAMRPLAAVLAATPGGHFVLDGTPRMCERPIEDLVTALEQLDCGVKCTQPCCIL